MHINVDIYVKIHILIDIYVSILRVYSYTCIRYYVSIYVLTIRYIFIDIPYIFTYLNKIFRVHNLIDISLIDISTYSVDIRISSA